jgi:hypothetical protein
MVVVVAHVCEAVHLFPEMGWGLEHSAGHYLDLGSAVLGLTSFPLGYLFHMLTLSRSKTEVFVEKSGNRANRPTQP